MAFLLKNGRRVLLGMGVFCLGLFIISFAFPRDFFWGRARRGESCVRCGARRHEVFNNVLGHCVHHSSTLSESRITRLWAELGEPCSHQWVTEYYNGRGVFLDYFTEFHYAVCSSSRAGYMAEAVGSFPTKELKLQALRTIACTNNYTRKLAETALVDLGLDERRMWSNWWTQSSNFFVIRTNMAEAVEVAQQARSSGAGSISSAAEEILADLEPKGVKK